MSNEKKYRKNMRCLDKWMSNRENGKWISDYLNAFHIQGIGIYGYGMLGKHLVRELQDNDFFISWVIDRSAYGDEQYGNIVRPDDVNSVEDVDMAVITSLADVEEVEVFLLGFVKGKVISVEELIDAVYTWGDQN